VTQIPSFLLQIGTTNLAETMATTLKVCEHIWDRDTVEPTTLTVTEDMWSRLKEIYPEANPEEDYPTQVWDFFVNHLTDEKRAELDEKILKGDFSGLHLQVLLDDYKGYVHLNQVASHVKSILKVYDNPHVTSYCREQGLFRYRLEVHDLSKASVIEIVTYTYKFVLQLCEFNDRRFQIGVDHHYKCNEHHPQYWDHYWKVQYNEYWDPLGMSPEGLLESILDMAGCRFERDLKSDPQTCLSIVFNIPEKFLSRYDPADMLVVKHHLHVFRTMKCGEYQDGASCATLCDK
jgi:hypothetical protein